MRPTLPSAVSPCFRDLIKVLKWYVDRVTEAERQEHIQEVLKVTPIPRSVRAAAAAPVTRPPPPTGTGDGVGWHSCLRAVMAAPELVRRARDFARLAHRTCSGLDPCASGLLGTGSDVPEGGWTRGCRWAVSLGSSWLLLLSPDRGRLGATCLKFSECRGWLSRGHSEEARGLTGCPTSLCPLSASVPWARLYVEVLTPRLQTCPH